MRHFLCLALLCCITPLQAQQSPCCTTPWAGIYPTVLTPWMCGCEGVDTQALCCQIQHQLSGCVHGFLVLGTLGEGMYASESERAQVISTAVACAQGKPVIVGIHACDYGVALQQLKQAKQLGAKAVLVKYTGPARTPFCEVLGFFHALADAGELPLFYYHIPGSVDRKLTVDEVVQVLSHPNIVGVKESVLDLREVQAHVRGVCGQGKTFLSGTALNLTQFKAVGGHGAMCPEAAILPGDTVAAYSTAYDVGDRRGARQQQRDLFVLAPVLKGGVITAGGARTFTMAAQDLKLPQQLGRDQSQARLKALLNERGVAMSAAVKAPLPQLTSWDRHLVRVAARKLD
jgi:dihydrodipicolinate synthase/N-acetylneuraminate lyase